MVQIYSKLNCYFCKRKKGHFDRVEEVLLESVHDNVLMHPVIQCCNIHVSFRSSEMSSSIPPHLIEVNDLKIIAFTTGGCHFEMNNNLNFLQASIVMRVNSG